MGFHMAEPKTEYLYDDISGRPYKAHRVRQNSDGDGAVFVYIDLEQKAVEGVCEEVLCSAASTSEEDVRRAIEKDVESAAAHD